MPRPVLLLLLLFTLPGISACGPEDSRQQLRVRNVGEVPIEQLEIYPDSPGEVVIGDVAPGETSRYVNASRGVLPYAAYAFVVDGRRLTQPVIDYVGEELLEGERFTYAIRYDASQFPRARLQLEQVTRDR